MYKYKVLCTNYSYIVCVYIVVMQSQTKGALCFMNMLQAYFFHDFTHFLCRFWYSLLKPRATMHLSHYLDILRIRISSITDTKEQDDSRWNRPTWCQR